MVTGQLPPHSHPTNFNNKVNTRLFYVNKAHISYSPPNLPALHAIRKSNPVWDGAMLAVLHLCLLVHLWRDRKGLRGTQTCLSRVPKKGQWHQQRPDCTCRARTMQEGCSRPAAPRSTNRGQAGCTCARYQSSSISLIRLYKRFQK